MSLNRAEQLTFDYLRRNPDEQRHWVDKIQRLARETPDDFAAVARLEPWLLEYFRERAGVVPAFAEFAAQNGPRPASLRGLAELLLRLHTPPRPRKKAKA